MKGAILYDALRKQIFISRHVVYHSSFFRNKANICTTQRYYIESFEVVPEPPSYFIASQHPCWVDAIYKELQALKSNQTWIING